MDPPPPEQVVLAEAQAWVSANTRTQSEGTTALTSFPENPSTSSTSQDDILALPTQEDQAAPSLSMPSQATTSMVALSPVVTASRKRKQASPQPCRDSTDMVGGPLPAKVQAKDKMPSETKHSTGKMLPVHCSIESVDVPPGKDKDNMLEGYAIVPSTLLLKELVRVAMTKLDYPKEQFRNAVGVIQIQNWKALPFSMITDDPQATVGQILGDLLSYITLKIKITSRRSTHPRTSTTPSPSPQPQLGVQPTVLGFPMKKSAGNETLGFKGAQEIRLKLLQLLEKRGPTMLVSHGCPFSQGTVLALLQCRHNKPIQQEKLQSFYQWYNIYNGLMDNTLVSAEKLDSMLPVKPSSRHWRRPRTLFDQRYELPRLMSWYKMNPRPTRAELEIYLADLNSSERRRNSHPLQYSSIAIWFKNARAKYRGMRGLSPDFLDTERVISRIGKVQTSQATDNVVQRRDIGNGSRQTYMQLSHAKSKTENKSRLTIQDRAPQKSVDLPVGAETRSFSSMRPSLSNGHVGINHSATLPTTDVSLSIFSKVVGSNSTSVEQPAATPTMPAASSSTSSSSQVTDIRKIASGFGIMLSPSVQDVNSHEQKLLPVQNIKVEDPSPTSTCSTSSHDAITVLNLSNSKPAFTSANPTSTINPTSATIHPTSATIHPTSATTPVAPSVTLATSMTPLRIPTTTMVHSTMSNGSMPHHPKLALSLSDPQRGPTIMHHNNSSKSIAHRQTRKRFNIHPSLEVPKLQAWFCVNPKPDRHTIEQFVAELNRTEFRKNQPKYDSRIVYVWFKNARAKYSRQKIRGEDGSADTSNLTLTYSRVIPL